MPIIQDIRCCDNMELMAGLPDKSIDLLIADPPYGIGFSDYERGSSSEKTRKRFTKGGKKRWDDCIPTEAYFKEAFRVSKNQIIWGGNYFPLPPTQCFIFWYKQNPVPNFADGEYAWTSFKRPAKCFPYRYYGNLEGHTSASKKIHPTQKPVQLYNFCLQEFGEKRPDFTVLDTHMGSGSSAIASYFFGVNYIGCDGDEDIFTDAQERIKQITSQPTFPGLTEEKSELEYKPLEEQKTLF